MKTIGLILLLIAVGILLIDNLKPKKEENKPIYSYHYFFNEVSIGYRNEYLGLQDVVKKDDCKVVKIKGYKNVASFNRGGYYDYYYVVD